jgi:hypothetical protein
MDHATHEPVSINRLAAGDEALPHRLRHRGGARRRHRHGAGLGNAATIVLAIVLNFILGYSLTIWPLVASGVVHGRH